jgi:glycosyltransferase involved in cell wall biosynthesis
VSKISFLVAFEEDSSGRRTQLWRFIKYHLEQSYPEAEIVEHPGDGDLPFNKSYALNRAAERAGGDIFIVHDADTWVDPPHVQDTVQAVERGLAMWAKPWEFSVRLSKNDTDRLLGYGFRDLRVRDVMWNDLSPEGLITPGLPVGHQTGLLVYETLSGFRFHRFDYAQPIIVRREDWESVGGMDESIRGWGGEDLAFGLALEAKVGKGKIRLGVPAINLWHSDTRRWDGEERSEGV